MKFLFSVTALFVAAISLTTTEASAQARTPMTPEATVHSFYEWYVHTLNQNEEPIERHRSEMGKFVTQRLLRSLDRVLKSPEGLDADFFLDAQDWDKDWEKNITTTKALIQGTRASLSVTLKGGPGFGNHKLRVGLRKEEGAWKIDSINGRRSP